MRYLLSFLFVIVLCQPAFSSKCIVDKDENVVAKINYDPEIKDLEARGEFVVHCQNDIVVGDADYRNKKVVKHVRTAKEIRAEQDKLAKIQARKIARQTAIDKLKVNGLSDDEIAALFGGRE